MPREGVGCIIKPAEPAPDKLSTDILASVIKVAVRVADDFSRVRLDLRPSSMRGVEACLTLYRDAPLRLHKLKVQRPLAPPRPYGLQPYQVTAAPPPPLPATQLHAACGVCSTGVVAALLVEPAARRGVLPRIKLQLSSARPLPEALQMGWAQRPPTIHTRFTEEQRALLLELFEKPERPNDAQMHETFKQRFSQAAGPYARGLRLTRAQIKSFMSCEKARRKKAAVAGVVVDAEAEGPLDSEEEDEAEDAADEAGRRPKARRKAKATPDPGGGQRMKVAEMRKAAKALGWGKEADLAKGTVAVRAVLQRAQAAPRRVSDDGAASDSSSSDDTSNEGKEDEEDEEALEGSDIYEVEVLLAKRRRSGKAEYLVRWKGYSACHDSWEPRENVARAAMREFEDARGPEEETDDDAEVDSGESEAEGGGADEGAAAAHAVGRKRAHAHGAASAAPTSTRQKAASAEATSKKRKADDRAAAPKAELDSSGDEVPVKGPGRSRRAVVANSSDEEAAAVDPAAVDPAPARPESKARGRQGAAERAREAAQLAVQKAVEQQQQQQSATSARSERREVREGFAERRMV